MNNDQIKIVQSTFEAVRPIASTASELFYFKLFELDPSLRSMFKGDMTQQAQKLMTMLGAAVSGLTQFETLLPVVHQLGVRHTGYGVRPEHYATVGQALIWTLEAGLKEKFTADARVAWTAVFALIAQTMQDGAQEAEQAAAVDRVRKFKAKYMVPTGK
jgi:hemoglobin-like flavoprotein